MSASLDELCNTCEQRLISACIEDLAALSMHIESDAEAHNTVKIVTALIASNEFQNLASAYRLWVGDMATALTENLSDVSSGGSISENYPMVAPGWEEIKCSYQLGYDLREYDSYLKHVTDLCEQSIQQDVSVSGRTLIYSHISPLGDDGDESPTADILEVIEDRAKTEALEVNPKTWLNDSEGEPLWHISTADRDNELFSIRDFLHEIVKKTNEPKTMVSCAVVLNYLNRLPQAPLYNFNFEIMHYVHREYICAECTGDEIEMEITLSHNGHCTSYGRFDQEGHHPGIHNAYEWVQAAHELLNLDAVITCDTEMGSITWFDDESAQYWDRLED